MIPFTLDGLQKLVLHVGVGVYLLEEWPQRAARPAGRSELQRAAWSQRQAGRSCHFSGGGQLVEEGTCHSVI